MPTSCHRYRLPPRVRDGDGRHELDQPGKVAWDWWNGLNVYGVPFTSGVNTETYKHFIDFAAENGLEYIILDEGWYKLGDLLSIAPAWTWTPSRRTRNGRTSD